MMNLIWCRKNPKNVAFNTVLATIREIAIPVFNGFRIKDDQELDDVLGCTQTKVLEIPITQQELDDIHREIAALIKDQYGEELAFDMQVQSYRSGRRNISSVRISLFNDPWLLLSTPAHPSI